MRLLFISQIFDPEYSIKGISLMQRLAAEGHDVEVLTTFPNYPTGKLFPEFTLKLKQVDQFEGIKVTRLWSYISHSKSKISRATSYISFSLFAIFTAFFSRKPDLIYAYHPQFTTGLIGLLMRTFRGVPYITDVQDIWPDALIATGMKKNSLILKFINFWCLVIYKYASRIVVLSDGFKNTLIDRGAAEEKIDVIYNWCPDEKKINQLSTSKANIFDKECVASFIYAGNIGSAQSLKTLIKALGSKDKTDFTLSIIGDGIEKKSLKNYVANKEFSNIIFRDYVAPEKIYEVLNTADVLVVHLKDDPLFKITIPSKTQSSMAMAKPLLMVVGGEANQIIVNANAGEVAEPENLIEIANAAKKLLIKKDQWTQLGRNSKKFYDNNFSMEVNYKKLANVIRKAGA